MLKVKVGLDKDEATIEAIRSVTKKPLRVDANEGLKTKEEAVRKINWLEKLGASSSSSRCRRTCSRSRSGCGARSTSRSSRTKPACARRTSPRSRTRTTAS